MLVLSQRTKEEIDRKLMSSRLGWFEQLQSSVQQSHIMSWRNHVHIIRLNRHTVFDFGATAPL